MMKDTMHRLQIQKNIYIATHTINILKLCREFMYCTAQLYFSAMILNIYFLMKLVIHSLSLHSLDIDIHVYLLNNILYIMIYLRTRNVSMLMCSDI